ncbi:MAG: TolC family protein [Bacteroidetes bacterium]|nr:TolC family protein [Bacteroidota bacterium]MBK9412833.1 TolC family protein [Bacteroidota bacterium]
MKKNKFALLLLLLFSGAVCAQENKLTIENAVKNALEKNYDVLIYSNLSQIEDNNNTIGNAGMLPNIDVNGSYTNSTNDLKQEYNTGAEVNRDASGSSNTNLDAGLVWTVFDGMKMFHTKKKLDGLFYQSEQQLKIQMEITIKDVVNAYYSIIINQQLLKATQQEIKLLEERLQLADRKLNNGSGSKLDQLQAKLEYNRQKSIELATISLIEESKLTLNRLMARALDSPVVTEDTIIISFRPSLEELKKMLPENNNLRYYEMNQRLAELSLKENQSLRYPRINLGTHYIFNRSTNEAGFTLLNQSQGYNYGATISFPIFHGFNINRQIKNAKLDVLNAKLQLSSWNDIVNADLLNTFRNFNNSIEIMQTEEDNILLAQEVLAIAQERYRIGISNAIELQDAFRSFEESMTRLVNSRFDAKTNETELRRLSGRLISDFR